MVGFISSVDEDLTYTDDDGTVYESAGHCGLQKVEKLRSAVEHSAIIEERSKLKDFYTNQYSESEDLQTGSLVLYQDYDGVNRQGIILTQAMPFENSWPELGIAYIESNGRIKLTAIPMFSIICLVKE